MKPLYSDSNHCYRVTGHWRFSSFLHNAFSVRLPNLPKQIQETIHQLQFQSSYSSNFCLNTETQHWKRLWSSRTSRETPVNEHAIAMLVIRTVIELFKTYFNKEISLTCPFHLLHPWTLYTWNCIGCYTMEIEDLQAQNALQLNTLRACRSIYEKVWWQATKQKLS